ncbi:hypothetical protein L3Q82_011127 [Scortum barcoo]|uniref:Uncharacterized protein n=1 Tax=Scortum barcoo TaxID=214431 RepID=A0ACB8W929_9TELE|nr:hypothetical protein L3Q82_011127 [Scortum barcoo]
MNPTVWSNGMYSSCLNGCTAEHLSSLQPDTLPSNSEVLGVSVTLSKEGENMKMLPESASCSSDDAGSGLISAGQQELSSSRNTGLLSTRRHPSPASSASGHHDWNFNSGHQAKRARVENIIKGMTSSPGIHCTDVTTNPHEELGGMHENEMIQELPLRQERSGSTSQAIRRQLESQHEPLRQLRTRFNHMEGENNTTDCSKEEKHSTWNSSPEKSLKDTCTQSYSEFEGSSSGKYQGWKKVKLMNYFQSKPERLKLMADVLKYELSRAVSRSVDSVFESMPLLQTLPNDEGNVETDAPFQSSVRKDKKSRLSCCENADVQVPDIQTEALSLVVQKPQLERADKLILQSGSRAHHRPKPLNPFSQDSALHEDQPPEKNHNAARQHVLRCLQDCPDVRQAKFEMLDSHRNPVKEGLTTNHLKKAKLMFFYTRYPSSLVLKTCFHDVQFTRCITSQLIKWFSNFREFYYIQMEKFARHALMEGAADVRSLTVGRESELFRALNMHYNKANDFQVPDRFVEVAEITLREFYVAISMGKDRDPSWKKSIYKVICKLDSDVPAEFKSHRSG